jgi:competence protein ComEA
MKTISYWIRGYFGFSQKEASGFIILSSLIILALSAPFIYDKLTPSTTNTSSEDQLILESLIQEMKNEEIFTAPVNKTDSVASSQIMYFAFDPNTANSADLQKLGIQKYVAERIIKFRDKGGKFRVKKDLKKIYGLSETKYEKLCSYILLPDSIPKAERKHQSKESTTLSFDLNKADTLQLNKLKGIANIMSARIIKYRDKLGGFIHKDQLKEIYGISPIALEELEKKTFIDRNFIPEKINLNSATVQDLSSHPYLGKKSAAAIVNYRSQHGNFATFEDLKQIISLTQEQMEKVKPYLSF